MKIKSKSSSARDNLKVLQSMVCEVTLAVVVFYAILKMEREPPSKI